MGERKGAREARREGKGKRKGRKQGGDNCRNVLGLNKTHQLPNFLNLRIDNF